MRKLILMTVLVSGFEFSIPGSAQEFHGFVDARYGMRTQSDPHNSQEILNELRVQLKSTWSHNLFTATVRSDFLYDKVADQHDRIDLETGEGPVDLREFNVLFTPADFMDVKVGRQILTWGTGDLLFVNDVFPKDWKSFFSGRDEDYLKAPSDALFVSLFLFLCQHRHRLHPALRCRPFHRWRTPQLLGRHAPDRCGSANG